MRRDARAVLSAHELEHGAVAIAAASSRSPSKPSVSQAAGVHAIGVVNGRSSRINSVSSARSTGHSIAAARPRRPPDGVTIPGGEQRAVDGDRQVERRAGDELLAVDVAAPHAWRLGRVDARLRRRHAHHAEERAQVELRPSWSRPSSRQGRVPNEAATARLADAEPVVQVRLPAPGLGDAPLPTRTDSTRTSSV